MVRIVWALVVVLVSVTIYAVIDCAQSNRDRIRAISKPAWFAIIILLPVIGVIMWFTLGRPHRPRGQAASGPIAPDDDPDFLRRLAEQSSFEARRHQREREAAEQQPDDAVEDIVEESESDDAEPHPDDPERDSRTGHREDRDAEN